MKPPKYLYLAPKNRAEVLELKREHGDESRVLAGGQSLVPMMNFRLVAPAALIDLNPLDDLAYIKQADDSIAIGAMTRQRTIEFSTLVAEKLPLLNSAIHYIAHLPIRTRGTIGGSIAHADPAAELPMILLALDGEVVAESVRGARKISASELFVSMFTTSLAADEVITEIRFPLLRSNPAYAIEEFSRRAGDFAIAAVAVCLQLTGMRCTKARIATAGIEAKHVRLTSAERLLEGHDVTMEMIETVAGEASRGVDPQSDLHASSNFRRHLTRVLCKQALHNAISRYAGGSRHARHG